MAKTEQAETTKRPRVNVEVPDTFEDVDADATAEATKPNPFRPQVEKMVSEWDDEKGRSKKSARYRTTPDQIAAHRRLLQNAAYSVGKGLRLRTQEMDDGTVSVIFQLAEKRAGNRKPATK